MQTGKSLLELAAVVEAQAAKKADFVVDTRKIAFQAERGHGAKLILDTADGAKALALTPHALGQVTEHVGIPAKYAQRMATEAPDLLSRNVNHWFQHDPSLRLVRGLRTQTPQLSARAFLSNRYQRLENADLLATVLPELVESNNSMQVLTTELTDTRMYLKVVFPKMEGEVARGDVVQYGFTLRNSEIGMGAMEAIPFIYRLVCLNGMTVSKDIDDTRMRRAHLGRALEEGADYFTEETLRADDRAIQLKLRDTLRAMQDPKRWSAVLERMRAAAQSEAASDPIVTVERVAETLALPKPESNAILTNFLKSGDLTKWGMVNAVTAVANDSNIVSFDRGQELEQLGGRILSLPATEWTRLAKAA